MGWGKREERRGASRRCLMGDSGRERIYIYIYTYVHREREREGYLPVLGWFK